MTDDLLCDILAQTKRTAAAVERLVEIAEVKREAREIRSTASEPRRSSDDSDLLTTTDRVTYFGLHCDRNGTPKTTKKGNTYWQLKLANDFQAMIFSKSIAKICEQAYDDDLMLIVEYKVSGKYSNVESVRLGAASPQRRSNPQPSAEEEENPF